MKNCLKGMLFLAVMGVQASTYYQPGLYGNALSGLYKACFSAPGTSIAPLYTQLLQPPVWSSNLSNSAMTNANQPDGSTMTYSLDSVFGAQQGATAASAWVNSGLTQYKPKRGKAILDSDTGAFTNQALLSGNATWSINIPNLQSYITANSTTGDLAYYNAAIIEYFSARLAMASSAFIFSPKGGSDQNSFLNVLYPSSNKTAFQERAIVNTFMTAAENLFSWSRYLRNITAPDGIGLTSISSGTISQNNGFTLGALETFVGLIVINNSNTNATSSNGVYGIQQVVLPSGQTAPAQASKLPASAMPTVSPTQKGLINPLSYPITVNAPITNLSYDPENSSLPYRFQYPGYSSFMVNLPNQNSISFLPVATQVYNNITAGGINSYAVQETADNWASAPVLTSGSFFRQVAFQTPNNGLLPTWSYIVGVGAMNASSAATTSPLITLQTVASTAGYNNSGGTYTPVTVDNTSSQVTVPFPSTFFEDKQPWAVVVTLSANSQQVGSPIVATVTGVVKLNSFDFPLMFAQDPLAQGYSATNPLQAKVTTPASLNTTYGIPQKQLDSLPKNPLLPTFVGAYPVSFENSLGIAFSQRDVWKGISSLYALTLQSHLEKENVGNKFHSDNYSFAYMFLQALFNGHLYSTTANSLYSVMKANNEIIGEPQIAMPTAGVIGNLSYDYVTEHNLPLYSLPSSPTAQIGITSTTPKAKGIWPINEPRIEPQASDWLQQGTPLDWLFLRALMVGRALMENTGITAKALPSIQSIMNPATTSSTSIPGYIPQTNTVITIPPSTN